MKLILKIIFLLLTIYLIIPYCIGLKEKIERPGFKNLPTNEYIWLGIILVIMIGLNVKWFYLDRRKSK